MHNKPSRTIKSFVLRQGKITSGQQDSLARLLPIYGVEPQQEYIDLNSVFGRNNPKIIEIGFGMGNATWQIAQSNPNNDYLGIEVHAPGVGSLLAKIEEQQIPNLRIIRHDAVDILKKMIPNNSIDGFQSYFPDPWPMKKHHKRRLIQADFIALLCSKLKTGAYIHLATDWQEYALWMLSVLQQQTQLKNTSQTMDFVPRPEFRPLTKFEQRGLNLGHGVWDIIFTKHITE